MGTGVRWALRRPVGPQRTRGSWWGVCWALSGVSSAPHTPHMSQDRPLQHLYFTGEETEAKGGTVTGAGSDSEKWQNSCDLSPHCQHRGPKGCGQQAAFHLQATSSHHPHWEQGPWCRSVQGLISQG